MALVAACTASPEDTDGEGLAEEDATLAASVVVASPRAAAAANVEENRIVLPISDAGELRGLEPGAVLVSARGPSGGHNPDGFLRRVASVSENGDSLVIQTSPATLTDAIVRGSMHASSAGPRAVYDDEAPEPASALRPLSKTDLRAVDVDFGGAMLFENTDEIGGARFVESIYIDEGHLRAKPSVDVSLDIRDGRVSSFTAKVEGAMDTTMRASALVTAEGSFDEGTLASLAERKHEISRLVYQSRKIALPNVMIGRVPVSPSVQFTVTLRCTLSFGGPLEAQAGVDATSFVRLAAMYRRGLWAPPAASDFDVHPVFGITRGRSAAARCSLDTSAELSAYGVGGVTMALSPYLDFDVRTENPAGATPALHYRVLAGANGTMRGKADVLGVRQEDLSRDLFEWKSTKPLEGTAP